MSHLTTVKSQVKDTAAVEAAAKALGVRLTKGGDVRYWYGTKSADYVLHLPGKYDLGLQKENDGTYSFVCDNELLSGSFGRNDASRQFLGDNAARFKQEYAAAVAMRLGAKKNVATFRKTREDGSVVITMRG